MSAQSYAVIETPIGWIGIAWSAHGLTNLQLPERDREGTRRRLLRRVPAALEARPQGAIAEAVALLERYAAGEEIDFGDVPLDLSGADPFRLAIYRAARRLGFGQTTTYGGFGRKRRSPRRGPRDRPGAGQQSGADHRALPPHPRGRQQDRRLFRPRRRPHQAPAAGHGRRVGRSAATGAAGIRVLTGT